MSNILSSISGPLDKSSCAYFFILTILFFVIFVISIIGHIFILIKDRKSLTFSNITGGVYMMFTLFMAYFVNRLMYTICNKSL